MTIDKETSEKKKVDRSCSLYMVTALTQAKRNLCLVTGGSAFEALTAENLQILEKKTE